MKILFFIKYNDAQIDELEIKIRQNKLTTYDEIMKCVIDESSNFFAPFVESMRSSGHNVELIVPNLLSAQKKWAQDKQSNFRDNWKFEVPIEQVKQFQPDILYVSSNFEYYSDFLESVKPYTKKIFAWISCPFVKETLVLDHIDHIFTLFEPHYNYFESIGHSCTLTHALFDQRVLPFISEEKSIEVSFVGGIGGYHKKREMILKKLVKNTPILLWGYGFKSKNKIKNLLKQMKYLWVFTKRFQGEAWGSDMLKILAKSKITFNAHGDEAIGHAVNMRMFEATGVGTLLVTEESPGIHKFFEPGKEVICYSSEKDAVDKINYYLEHEEERNKIAEAGQKRTLEHYTFDKITPEYLKIFEQKLLQDEEHSS